MTTVTIDNTEYELESLTDEARDQLTSINFVDQEIARLQGLLAAMQTARNAYANALSELLPKA